MAPPLLTYVRTHYLLYSRTVYSVLPRTYTKRRQLIYTERTTYTQAQEWMWCRRVKRTKNTNKQTQTGYVGWLSLWYQVYAVPGGRPDKGTNEQQQATLTCCCCIAVLYVRVSHYRGNVILYTYQYVCEWTCHFLQRAHQRQSTPRGAQGLNYSKQLVQITSRRYS